MEIDPWGSDLIEYDKTIKEFGLELFDASRFTEPSTLMKRGMIFAGRGLNEISEAIKNKKKFYVLSGIQPSAEKIHIGTKMVVENIKYFQKMGGKTFIVIADVEASATRNLTIEEAQQSALNFHIPAYIALGLDPKKTTFYFQSENMTVHKLSTLFSQKITENEFKGLYGDHNIAKTLAVLNQMGDIFYPQYAEGPAPTIIPCGIDQDPHIRLARDLARKFKDLNFYSPSSVFNKFTPSLDGKRKMSKSIPDSCVFLPDDDYKRKIMRALTGGRDNVEEQKKLGGNPDACMIFELYKEYFVEDDEKLKDIYTRCRKGKLLCGEDKQYACGVVGEFMEKLKDKMSRVKTSDLKFVTK